MSKKWLTGMNVLLGALSMGLLGCKSSSHECLYGPPPQPDKYGCPPEEFNQADSTQWIVESEEEAVKS